MLLCESLRASLSRFKEETMDGFFRGHFLSLPLSGNNDCPHLHFFHIWLLLLLPFGRRR